MIKFINLTVLLIFILSSCQNNSKEIISDSLENDAKKELNQEIRDSGREGTIKAFEKCAIYVMPNENWIEEKQNDPDINYDEYVESIENNLQKSIAFLKEKNIKIINAENEFNIFFKSLDKTVDLRLEKISDIGYSIVLINPDSDFEIYNDENNIEELYNKIFL